MLLTNKYNFKKGKQLFDNRAGEATMTELSQVDEVGTFAPEMVNNLSEEDKRRMLN